MKELLRKFESRRPEIVFEWHDHYTEAEGWVVINSLRGGAAGGGTRMRKGLDKSEVVSLAKTMEVKFTVSGPPIGGAKSGINFDPRDPRKEEVLRRWFQAVSPILKNYYGTGGDLNVDEVQEVIPITESFGLWHPQEGIVNGHQSPSKPEKIHMIGRLRQGVSKVLEDQQYVPTSNRKYTVSDMITGFGVAESVKHFYGLWLKEIKGKRAIIQGWGNVGATAATYLSKYGVKIVGIIDKVGGVISEEGFSLEEVKELFYKRKGNILVTDKLIPFDECNEKIWSCGAEIFIPAAASRLVSRDQVEAMLAHDLEVVACGANVPFQDEQIFYGPIAEMVDQNAALIPDFIANCGMARTFAYLMDQTNNAKITDHDIFHDISTTIKKALTDIHEQNPQMTRVAETGFEIALNQLI